jgi:hypothetical protein
LTALAITSPIGVREIGDRSAIVSLAHALMGMTSVGLSDVLVVIPRISSSTYRAPPLRSQLRVELLRERDVRVRAFVAMASERSADHHHHHQDAHLASRDQPMRARRLAMRFHEAQDDHCLDEGDEHQGDRPARLDADPLVLRPPGLRALGGSSSATTTTVL